MPGHLTLEERDRLAQMHSRGFNQKEIAVALDRSPSTISRELRRNHTRGEYLAAQAHRASARRRCERPLARKMDDPQINAAVRRGLAQDWSPDEISRRLHKESPDAPQRCVSPQTIYDWIKKSPDREHWESHLRRRGKRPSSRKPATRPDAARIKNRPEVIEQRLRLGDFEGDTVLGPPGTGGLVTLVERRSRYTLLIPIRSKNAQHVQAKIRRRLKQLNKDLRRTITFDNGTEFARCDRLAKHLEMTLYYADPGCPFQRGTNENTNGLLRQYFPKGTDFRNVTPHE